MILKFRVLITLLTRSEADINIDIHFSMSSSGTSLDIHMNVTFKACMSKKALLWSYERKVQSRLWKTSANMSFHATRFWDFLFKPLRNQICFFRTQNSRFRWLKTFFSTYWRIIDASQRNFTKNTQNLFKTILFFVIKYVSRQLKQKIATHTIAAFHKRHRKLSFSRLSWHFFSVKK